MSKHTRRLPRREFVRVVGAAAATLPAARYAKILGANDRVRVGIVGFSDRFRQAHLPAYGQLGKELNFEIVAVSDIWSRRRDEGVAGIEKVMGTKPRAFRNNEEMYAARATDAVVITFSIPATPSSRRRLQMSDTATISKLSSLPSWPYAGRCAWRNRSEKPTMPTRTRSLAPRIFA